MLVLALYKAKTLLFSTESNRSTPYSDQRHKRDAISCGQSRYHTDDSNYLDVADSPVNLQTKAASRVARIYSTDNGKLVLLKNHAFQFVFIFWRWCVVISLNNFIVIPSIFRASIVSCNVLVLILYRPISYWSRVHFGVIGL